MKLPASSLLSSLFNCECGGSVASHSRRWCWWAAQLVPPKRDVPFWPACWGPDAQGSGALGSGVGSCCCWVLLPLNVPAGAGARPCCWPWLTARLQSTKNCYTVHKKLSGWQPEVFHNQLSRQVQSVWLYTVLAKDWSPSQGILLPVLISKPLFA
jgi:hypothetical protein